MVCDDFDVSDWTLQGTSKTGERIEVRGFTCLSWRTG
jgi:hypothetical protein